MQAKDQEKYKYIKHKTYQREMLTGVSKSDKTSQVKHDIPKEKNIVPG